MQRVTITIDDDLADDLERFMAMRGYANRSEAIRDLARSGLQQGAAQVAGRNSVLPRSSMFTTTSSVNCRNGLRETSTITMTLRKRRYTFIWITKAVWR